MKKAKNIVLIILGAIVCYIVSSAIFIGILYLISASAEIEVNEDITKYNNYIGENAHEEYINKWDMDETIFPKEITKNMAVEDYKMVYYNPWDAQYLSYLVVDYTKEDYIKEMDRLKSYNSTEYIGYYNVTGFDKYELIAMYADEYNGFVYAITDGESKVIYVELIFCNYSYDLDYTKYINEEYLPNGFDATSGNSYQKKMLSK